MNVPEHQPLLRIPQVKNVADLVFQRGDDALGAPFREFRNIFRGNFLNLHQELVRRHTVDFATTITMGAFSNKIIPVDEGASTFQGLVAREQKSTGELR
jgi:hypothetical protein